MEPVRRLEYEYRVRFDEADADGWLRPSGLLRFAQDMAWRHSEEAGFGRDWYDARGLHWLVRNVRVTLHGQVTYGDALAISTEVTGWRQVWARRHSEVRRLRSSHAGLAPGHVATVDTDWVLLTDTGHPARTPQEIATYFSPVVSFPRDRVVLPAPTGPVTTLSTSVRPHDVDPMRHMSNAAYLDMVDDGLARMLAEERLKAPDIYRIGYVAPALPGTSVHIDCWTVSATQVACRISDDAGTELTKALVSRRA